MLARRKSQNLTLDSYWTWWKSCIIGGKGNTAKVNEATFNSAILKEGQHRIRIGKEGQDDLRVINKMKEMIETLRLNWWDLRIDFVSEHISGCSACYFMILLNLVIFYLQKRIIFCYCTYSGDSYSKMLACRVLSREFTIFYNEKSS